MRTMQRSVWLAGVGLLIASGATAAEIGSDKAAAIVVYPKVVAGQSSTAALPSAVDTEIQLTNTAPHQIAARCYLINANSHCSNAAPPTIPLVCQTHDDCNPSPSITGGRCIPGWQETDFRVRLTARQPIVWNLSDGLPAGDFPLDGLLKVGPIDPDTGLNASNIGSSIPPAPESPFQGELKCIQVDVATEQPSQGTNAENNFAGDLIGQATIIYDAPDDGSYNAIGIQAVQDANDGNDQLVLGQEYAGCPSVLILDHFFDDAQNPADTDDDVTTTLTLVPCSENFFLQSGLRATTVVQLLIFNEFEQRFSRSTSVTCFKSTSLTALGSLTGNPDDSSSVLNVNVAGTLTGQTRIRAVDGSDPSRGDGLLALAEESTDLEAVGIFNVHFTGTRTRPDFINLSPIECGPNPGQEPCP